MFPFLRDFHSERAKLARALCEFTHLLRDYCSGTFAEVPITGDNRKLRD